jgi:hypothetical protein
MRHRRMLAPERPVARGSFDGHIERRDERLAYIRALRITTDFMTRLAEGIVNVDARVLLALSRRPPDSAVYAATPRRRCIS